MTVPQVGLMCEALGDWQGPAIWFYNSVPAFTSDDLDCFTRSVGDSAKAGNSGKIGQFGLGAITACHFTDVIQLLSGPVILTPDASAALSCVVSIQARLHADRWDVITTSMRTLATDAILPAAECSALK